jgi:Rps23 Pro-64 3,4-dihydroxylase Tpa1-like proline 4-hydroxylase
VSNIKVTVHTEPFHYIEVRNLWTEQERTEMFDEMLYLEKKALFKPPEETGSAVDDDKNVLKKNNGMWIDEVWYDRDYSDILKHNRKLFKLFENKKVKESWYYDGLNFNADSTLVSYYEDDCYYKPHRDKSVVTVLSWFFKAPKKFNGGEITFTDYDLTFEVTNDLTILFPSNIKHEVSEISIDDEYKGKQYGRFCMSQFLNNTL